MAPPVATPPPLKAPPARWRRGLGVASRSIAAIGGGYLLAALASIACAVWFPMARPEAVVTGMLVSLVVMPLAILWVFAARTASWAWGGVLVPVLLLAGGLRLAGYLP